MKVLDLSGVGVRASGLRSFACKRKTGYTAKQMDGLATQSWIQV